MGKRVVKALITCFAVGVFLTGCGSQFPEMTDDEYNQTVQYMVSLLMKYSNNGVEKLSSLSSLELQRQMAKEARDSAKAERDAQTAAAIANMSADTADTDGATDVDETEQTYNTESTDAAQNDLNEPEQTTLTEPEDETTENTNQEDQITENTNSEDDIDKLLNEYGDELDEGIKNSGGEVPDNNTEDIQNTPQETEPDKVVQGMRQELSKGMFLTYSGYSVASTYPDNDDVFVINATSGKKLLILNFRLANTSGMDVSVDMEKANPHFQVILNGVNVGYTNVTMLDNDLSSYSGTITSGEKKSMVLIKQMDASKLKNVESLGLIGDLGGEIIEFSLE